MRRRKARPFANDEHDQPRAEQLADGVAERDPRTGRNDCRANIQICKKRKQMSDQTGRTRLHGRRRQTVGDDKGDITQSRAALIEALARRNIEQPAKIRTLEVVAARCGLTCDTECFEAERLNCRGQSVGIETCVYGVARAGVIEREIKQSLRRQARSGSTKPDPGRS